MKTLARLAAVAAVAVGVLAAAPAQAAQPVPVTGCGVSGGVLTMVLEGGAQVRVAHPTINSAQVFGTVRVVKPAARRGGVWTRCGARSIKGRRTLVIRTTGRAVWHIRNPRAYAPVVLEGEGGSVAAPIPARPVAVAEWRGQGMTLSAPALDPSWGLAGAVAAYNTVLPSDRQIALTTEACPAPRGNCVPVGEVPIIAEGTRWGQALWSYDEVEATMFGCAIELSSVVPAGQRAGVAAHEVGHCLGLPHWDAIGHSVMEGTGHAGEVPGPTAADLAWVAETYQG